MTTIPATLSLRQLDAGDWAAIERLAGRDTRPVPEAPLLGAEVEGTLLAAISLETGAVIADPFSRTAELSALLELRAAQLRQRALLPIGRTRPCPEPARVAAATGGLAALSAARAEPW